MMSQRISLILPDELFEDIETLRGLIKRNTYIVHLLEKAVESEKIVEGKPDKL